MAGKWFMLLISRFGTIILAFYIAWLGWQQLGPRKPEIGPVRKVLADKAAQEIVETLRQNKNQINNVVLVHFVNDPTDYFTDSLRRQIEEKGIFDIKDRTFFEKVRNKLNLRHPAGDSTEAGAKIAKLMKVEGSVIGSVKSFESYPGGSKIEVVYELVSAQGNVVYAGQYVKDSNSFFLKPESIEESVQSVRWFQRALACLLLVLLLPVFTISFIRSMVRRRSNGQNAFVLAIYTLADAVFAWLLVGAALDGFMSVLVFAAAVAAAFAYNIRIMTFALKLED